MRRERFNVISVFVGLSIVASLLVLNILTNTHAINNNGSITFALAMALPVSVSYHNQDTETLILKSVDDKFKEPFNRAKENILRKRYNLTVN